MMVISKDETHVDETQVEAGRPKSVTEYKVTNIHDVLGPGS